MSKIKRVPCLHDFENGIEVKRFRKYGYVDKVGHEVIVMQCCKCKRRRRKIVK